MKHTKFELIFRSCDARSFVSLFPRSHLFHFLKGKKKDSIWFLWTFEANSKQKLRLPNPPAVWRMILLVQVTIKNQKSDFFCVTDQATPLRGGPDKGVGKKETTFDDF